MFCATESVERSIQCTRCKVQPISSSPFNCSLFSQNIVHIIGNLTCFSTAQVLYAIDFWPVIWHLSHRTPTVPNRYFFSALSNPKCFQVNGEFSENTNTLKNYEKKWAFFVRQIYVRSSLYVSANLYSIHFS